MESFADFDSADLFASKEPLDENGKPLERWAPLGANDSAELSADDNLTDSNDVSDSKQHMLSEEHDVVNTSLLTLTSHFAQVQFRLEQVLRAEPDQKESLLKELEEFAWKGAPDLHLMLGNQSNSQNDSNCSQDDAHRKYVSVIIDQLKIQLHDLEQYAYQSGELHEPPTQSVLQKQRFVLEELGKQGLDLSDFSAGSEEQIREKVNAAMAQIINPIKTKEALVDQLKTQITDLERFIEFLHDETTPDSVIKKTLEAFRSYQQERRGIKGSSLARLKSADGLDEHKGDAGVDADEEEAEGGDGGFHIGLSRRQRVESGQSYRERRKFSRAYDGKQIQDQKAFNIITRALTLLQFFASSQLPGRSVDKRRWAQDYANAAAANKYESGSKNTAKQQHWGDVRARLELAIEVVLEKALALKAVRLQHYHSLELPKNRQGGEDARVSVVADERQPGDGQTSSSSFECCNADYRDPACAIAERELNNAVRKQLCRALEELIEHGSRLPAHHSSTSSRFGGAASLVDTSQGFGGLLFSLLGCFSRNRLEGRTSLNGADSGEDSNGEDDEYLFESEDERQARNLRRKRSQSSAWAIFVKYYVMTNGRAFNDTPARKLSQSFALDIIGGKVVTAKQQLLSSMGTVLQEFIKYKRSEEAQFKALVCIALNNHRLVSWLKIVLRSPLIVQYMYHPWSYVSSTGFDDALQSLNKLTSVDFRLPFDATIRHLQDIRDVF